jgi:hypothetical protein
MVNNIQKAAVVAWCICVLCSLQAPLASAKQKASGDLTSQLNRKIDIYQLDVGSFGEALVKVASDFKIPLGIEWVDNSNSRTRLKRSWKDSTVLNILRETVGTQPAYKIDVGTSVVHIRSATLVPERENPLRIVIPTYEVNNVPLEEASRRLHGLVRSRLKTTRSSIPGHEKPGGTVGSLLTNPDEPKITVELYGASVERCLDALTLSSSHKIWIATFSVDARVDSTPFRRTSTLWNNYPVQDDDQPIWDFLRWGDSLPAALSSSE